MVAVAVPTSAEQPKATKLRAGTIPIQTRLRARNLYISQGLPPKQVGELCGLTSRQVINMSLREAWTKQRDAQVQRQIKTAQTRTDAVFEEFNDVLAREAEEISLGALQNARKRIVRDGPDDPKEFQALVQGISTLVKTSRTVRGLDNKQESGPTTNLTLNLFTIGEAPTPRAMRPAIEVSAAAQIGS